MTPEQRQQIKDLIAAGENAPEKIFKYQDMGDVIELLVDDGQISREMPLQPLYEFLMIGHTNRISGDALEFFYQAANSREAIEAMQKENERLREALKKIEDYECKQPDHSPLSREGWLGRKVRELKNIAKQALTNETKESDDG